MRICDLGTRVPPINDVKPLSPVLVYNFMELRNSEFRLRIELFNYKKRNNHFNLLNPGSYFRIYCFDLAFVVINDNFSILTTNYLFDKHKRILNVN